MHYKKYFVRDGVPIMPDLSDTSIIMYTLLNGDQYNLTKRTHDILDFGFIIEDYGENTSLNQIRVKSFVRVREKSTNKIYAGVSEGYNVGYGQRTLWPNLVEV